ncbi:exodeoxyribonuclease VII small subunit [Teredinibacter waterburyi]|uniref:exodeoxyribonuclease VII small subunit n=1 Tax=Teredinibacter waterburyi TaxID=1500538 RepID=UPI00165FA78D|nr:exodeoxyribonuclease VII small subunit [Teredinibacter waterburyi]
MATKKALPDFEQSLGKLEDLVASLESGDLTLEESLKTFEQGIKLTRSCQTALTEAEQKVNLLLEQDNGELSETPFPTDDDQ